MKAAQKLVHHYKSRRATADALQVTRETIRLWLRDGIPLEKALEVEQRCGNIVTAEEILREARQAA